MFCKLLKLNIKSLSNEIVDLNVFKNKQIKKTNELDIKLNSVLANQKLLFFLIKKLADCFQLEYANGNYVSK